jgi:hypothetical protein
VEEALILIAIPATQAATVIITPGFASILLTSWSL